MRDRDRVSVEDRSPQDDNPTTVSGMSNHDLNRRDFTRLSAAAFGGLMAGSLAGCTQSPPPAAPPATPPAGSDAGADAGGGAADTPAGGDSVVADASANFLLGEKHACRGLNICKGHGADGMNECAGQGTCATIDHHSCGGDHACKGQSGCGNTAGVNSCKTEGSCAVPMHEPAWSKARETFEKLMQGQNKEFGAAPAAEE